MAVTVVVCVMVFASTPASAAWKALVIKTSGTTGMATLTRTFTPIKLGVLTGAASGTGGSNYTSATVSDLTGVTDYVDITSTATVTVDPSVVITANFSGSVSLFPNITVTSCAVAWNTTLNSCSSGQTTIATYQASTTPAYSWGSLTTASPTLHIRMTVGGVNVGNVSIAAFVANSGVRAGIDRTTG